MQLNSGMLQDYQLFCCVTALTGVALLNSISLQMFKKKMKMSPTIFSIRKKKWALLAMINTLVTIIHKTWAVLEGAKYILSTSI